MKTKIMCWRWSKYNTVNATNDLGALHLETLLQLLQNSSTDFYFPTAVISDKPRFAWRIDD
jgi:hexosaminidase